MNLNEIVSSHSITLNLRGMEDPSLAECEEATSGGTPYFRHSVGCCVVTSVVWYRLTNIDCC